jgi:hypothetical protein
MSEGWSRGTVNSLAECRLSSGGAFFLRNPPIFFLLAGAIIGRECYNGKRYIPEERT